MLNSNLDTITHMAFTSSKFTYKRNTELYKNNRTVYMSFNNHVDSLNHGDILATLPTSYIPCSNFWQIPVFTGNTMIGRLECNTSGNIIYYGDSVTGSWILATTSWITAN